MQLAELGAEQRAAIAREVSAVRAKRRREVSVVSGLLWIFAGLMLGAVSFAPEASRSSALLGGSLALSVALVGLGVVIRRRGQRALDQAPVLVAATVVGREERAVAGGSSKVLELVVEATEQARLVSGTLQSVEGPLPERLSVLPERLFRAIPEGQPLVVVSLGDVVCGVMTGAGHLTFGG